MPQNCVEIPNEVLIEESVDLHDHLRDLAIHGDGRMEMSVKHAVGEHGIIVSIGNNARTVVDQQTVDQHISDAWTCIPSDSDIVILAAPLVTDTTTRAMVTEMRVHSPRTAAFLKVFLYGVSNDAGKSVRDLANIDDAVRATYDDAVSAPKLPVHCHTEEKFNGDGKRIAMSEREYYAMRYKIVPLIERHKDGVFVIKHVSDARTLHLIRQLRRRGYEVYAEICPHYLYCCHEDLYEGPGGGTAFNANNLCWPIFKSEASMNALNNEVVNPEDWIMFGSDRAIHLDDPLKLSGVKITIDGIVCGGVCILPAVQKSLVIDRFVEAGMVHHLDAYLSRNARRVHHLPLSTKKVRYIREPWEAPRLIGGRGPKGAIHARPFMGGQIMNWKRVS